MALLDDEFDLSAAFSDIGAFAVCGIIQKDNENSISSEGG